MKEEICRMKLQDKQSKQTIARPSKEKHKLHELFMHHNEIRMNLRLSFCSPALHGDQRQNWNLLFFSVSVDLRMKHALHNM